MRRIAIENPSIEKTYKTYVDSDYSSGTTLTVKSNTSYATDNLIIVGEPTEEFTEEKKIQTISGTTTLNLASGLNFSHPKGTPVYRVVWDFISIERRTSSAGTFAEITQSGIQWDSKTNETIYYDSEATNTYQFRFRFYNSVTGVFSEYSPTITGAILGRTTVQFMLDEVRKVAGDQDRKIVSDDEIIRFFNEAQDIIYAHNPKYFFLYVDTFESGSGSIAATADNRVYTLANLSNFGELGGIKYRYISGATDNIYHLTQLAEAEFDYKDGNLNATQDNWPQIYKILPADASSVNGYFRITPRIKDSNIGTFYPLYYEKMADLATVADTTQVPLPYLIESLAIADIFRIKGNDTKAKMYEAYLLSDNPDKTPQGLILLDKMDRAKRIAQNQPRYVSRFRGQKAVSRLYGNKYPSGVNMDYIRENYF